MEKYTCGVGANLSINFRKEKNKTFPDGRKEIRFTFYLREKDEAINIQVILQKAIDAYRERKRAPQPIEVIHKGTVVNVNVNSKGFLLNIDPCPTCGASLYLSQDRKTAYCRYCNKEIPTVEQLREE